MCLVCVFAWPSQDGFRGSYDEVVAHEAKLGLSAFADFHKPAAAKEHAGKLYGAIAAQKAEVAALKQQLQQLQALKASQKSTTGEGAEEEKN